MKNLAKIILMALVAIAIQSCSVVDKLPQPTIAEYYKKGTSKCVFEKEGKRLNSRYVWNHGN